MISFSLHDNNHPFEKKRFKDPSLLTIRENVESII